MTGRHWAAVALYVLAVASLAVCVPPLTRGDIPAPFYVLAVPLTLAGGRLWKTGEEEGGRP